LHKLRVRLQENSYNILIGRGLLGKTGELIESLSNYRQVLLVSNPTVYALYGQAVCDCLHEKGYKVTTALMPDGEQYKNLDEAGKILDIAVDAGLERSDLVIALGGGVVGDLAGFVASIYQRGIDYVQIPTTLLAQVDSSVGGKVAVNHPRGKNLIGAFHQPRLVIIDSLTLKTLKVEDYINGLGEVVKYAIANSRDLFNYLVSHAEEVRNKGEDAIEQVIFYSCRIKADIVEKDEKEMGQRVVLNFGHTFGHSLEKIGNYTDFRHGQAVAMGIIPAVYMADDLGLIEENEITSIKMLYRKLNLPGKFPYLDAEDIYRGMLNDKKVRHNQLRLVLPQGIGNNLIMDNINSEQVIQAIIRAQQEDFI